jgi:D-alanyl-D-alanine carboxypeptidase
MNIKARTLKMFKTTYANSHGLINYNNKSCAYDIALLSEHVMKN